MTYLDYIVQFQRLRRQQPFSSASADLYYHLLWTANNLGWKNPFTEGNPIIMASLGMSDKTLMSAREKLVVAGLLKFTPGKKGCYSTYELLSLPNNTENFRGNWEQSRSNEGAIGGQPGENAPSYNRSKIKSKTKEATASVSEPDSSPSLPASVEPWAAWLAEHAPTVQRLKSPLTAEHYTKLVADFGEPLLREVLAGMENHAGLLKKYTSANLTARDWCKRRLPNGQPPAPPPPAGPPVSLELDVNEEFEAQQRARAQAEADERARQFRATYATS